MKLRHVLPLLLVCVFCLGACEQQAPSVAIVDLQRAMRDCDAGKKGVDKLNAMAKEAEAKLKPLQEQLEKKPDDADLQAKLQQMALPLQQRLQAEQQSMMYQLGDTAMRVMNKLREQKGYAVILPADVAFSHDAKLDVTNELIAELNKEKIEFTPLPEAGKQDEAATDAPADKDAAKPEADGAAKKDGEAK